MFSDYIISPVIDRLAHLARIRLTESQTKELQDDLTVILDWVEKLNELDTEGVEPLLSMSKEINNWRDDVVGEHLDREDALQNAPNHDNKFFKVPKVI
jgi:aspartyl-tRNA(Asn)/glutamyl-tRNA(Gln) amidotransferase subunit C